MTYERPPNTVPDPQPGGDSVKNGVPMVSDAVDDLYTQMNSHSNNEQGRTHLAIDQDLDDLVDIKQVAIDAKATALEASTQAAEAQEVAEAAEAGAVEASVSAEQSAAYVVDYQKSRVARDVERNALDQYAWGVSGANNRVALGVTPDGALSYTKAEIRSEPLQRNAAPFVHTYHDRLGRLALGFKGTGQVEIPKLGVSEADIVSVTMPASQLSARERGNPYIWVLCDREDMVALGVDAQGATTFKPSSVSLREIETGRYIPPDAFSTEYNVSNVRELNDCQVATRCDSEQFVFDVRQLKESEAGAAVIEHHGKLLFLPFGGQSNSGQGGSTGVSFPDAAYPHNCLTFANAAQKQGEVAAVESEFLDLKQVRDASWDGQFPATMASFALESSLRESTGQTGQGTLCFTAWYPGMPLEELVRGTVPFENIMVAARRAPVVAARYGKDCECPFYTFVHGEAGPYPYYDDFVAYAADIAGEIATQMGQVVAPEFVFLQINNRDYDTAATGVEQDQLDAAVDYHGNGLTLAGPMYHCPFADYIHQTPEGRMLVGEMLAECYRTILAGEQFTPLWPTSVTRTDAVIDITFAVPGNGLALDTDWVPTVPNQGFVYEDDTSSAAISTVEIVGTDTVRITLDAVPTGTNKQIHYAKATATFADGWANGRGHLYSPTDRDSFYHRRGFSIPSKVRHYAVRFTEEVL